MVNGNSKWFQVPSFRFQEEEPETSNLKPETYAQVYLVSPPATA